MNAITQKIAILGLVGVGLAIATVRVVIEFVACFIMALGAYFYLRSYPEWLMKIMPPNPWVPDPISHLTEADGYVVTLSLLVLIVMWGLRISLHNNERRW